MASTILLKRSSTASSVPAAGSLQAGELAVNLADQKLYSKTSGGAVVQVGFGNLTSAMVTTSLGFTPYNSTNPSGYITGAGRAYPRKADGGDINFNWSGQSGQPAWLWGGGDGTNMYVYNPSNFSVNYASSAGGVSVTLAGAAESNLCYAQIADNDFFRIRVGGTSSNAGWAEIATADDGNEPIYVRQYTGIFTSVARTATLLDSSGNTVFPGSVTAGGAVYASNWHRCYGTTGLYNETYGRGITVPDGTVSYGNMMAYGAGLNGWQGFSLSPNNKTNWMTDGNSWGMYNAVATGWMMSADMAGNVTFSGNVTAYSDLRLKDNVREIDEVTARRDALASSAIMYERDGRTRIGYGAQYLRDRGCSEFVHEADDALKLATGLGTLSVDYGETTAVLAVASKNTYDMVSLLEARIARLEALIVKQSGG